MREAQGGTWLLGLVLTFTLFFVAFLSISAHYTKVFKVKNEVLDIIERNEGVSTWPDSPAHLGGGTILLINGYLFQSGYQGRGQCPDGNGWLGVRDYTYPNLLDASNGSDWYYCIRKIKSPLDMYPDRAYYEVALFFRMDLPVIGPLLTFKVTGTTIPIVNPTDNIVPGS